MMTEEGQSRQSSSGSLLITAACKTSICLPQKPHVCQRDLVWKVAVDPDRHQDGKQKCIGEQLLSHHGEAGSQ